MALVRYALVLAWLQTFNGSPLCAQRARTEPFSPSHAGWRIAPSLISQRDDTLPVTYPSSKGSATQLASWSGRGTKPHSPWAVLASAALPGSGQAMLRQWRAIPYVVLEGLAVREYSVDSRRARRDRDAYRTLAATVARAAFGGSLPTGDFDYYERMETFIESGAFDASPGGLLEPEQDTTTFNGATWLLARRTFWKDVGVEPPRSSAEWQRAESFYLQRAVRQEFRWSWRDNPGELGRFRRFIKSSNDGYREAVADLGVIIGNHFLSTIDSYATVRIRRGRSAGQRYTSVGVSVGF